MEKENPNQPTNVRKGKKNTRTIRKQVKESIRTPKKMSSNNPRQNSKS